jgi:uncharacterized protein with von Willebrand factor type A (vWA) domain
VTTYSYSEYTDGPDPLELPYDVRGLADAIAEAVLAGATPAEALNDLFGRGLLGRQARRALDHLLRQIRDRQREICRRGRLDGILEQVRVQLDAATGQERDELSHDPSAKAKGCELDLDALPADAGQAISRLADYDWRSAAARKTFERLKELLLSEVLDTQFRGLSQTLRNPGPKDIRRIKDMLSDLNAVLAADDRGQHTRAAFAKFMQRYADLFLDHRQEFEEFTDSLLNRTAAADYVLCSLSAQQREELGGLVTGALDDAGLAAEMARLVGALRAKRPDLDRADGIGSARMSGEEPLSLSDATSALEELTDLTALENALCRADLDDIDENAAARLLDRNAADGIHTLGRMTRELERQGYLKRDEGRLDLTPRTVRRLGDNALRRIFGNMNHGRRPGDHDQPDTGQTGELTTGTRPWTYGDEQPFDIPATLRNALLRTGRVPIRMIPGDFEVVQTERRTAAAVSLLLDHSYSMALRGCWEPAKQTALALLALLRSRFPQDAVQLVCFSDVAREVREVDLAGLGYDMVQGTNLHHALMLAVRHIDRHPQYEPVVLLVTDGEPTAHLRLDGRPWFDWPPSPETIELTMSEVDKLTRRHAALSIFLLANDIRLIEFTNDMAKRSGASVFEVDPQRLDEALIREYLRTRTIKKR